MMYMIFLVLFAFASLEPSISNGQAVSLTATFTPYQKEHAASHLSVAAISEHLQHCLAVSD
jgi:uncharacterized membrane protein YgdD (TMEM256/DUF423 family)